MQKCLFLQCNYSWQRPSGSDLCFILSFAAAIRLLLHPLRPGMKLIYWGSRAGHAAPTCAVPALFWSDFLRIANVEGQVLYLLIARRESRCLLISHQ
ncbi:hypothetical protein CEXT_706181 [Caerostris extrusa]|uniref:Uncharacterized protein n=1 Tax=Caerostris extrusa TaxID=172846 RepID=A0AAV4XF15_CAEEX|nr:hypothetical protein CEXT_706181 [Caerostris extrusa]